MALLKQGASHLRLASDNYGKSLNLSRGEAARFVVAFASYREVVKKILKKFPEFPAADWHLWDTLKEMGQDGSLYNPPFEGVAERIAQRAIDKYEKFLLFGGKSQESKSGSLNRRDGRHRSFEGFRHLTFQALVFDPSYSPGSGVHLNQVFQERGIHATSETLTIEQVTPQLVQAVLQAAQKKAEMLSFATQIMEADTSI